MTEIRGTAVFPFLGTEVHVHWSTAFSSCTS